MRFCITRSSFSSAEGFHFLFYSLLQVSPAYRSDFARKLCSSNFTFSYGCRTEVSHRLLVSEVVFLSLLSFFFHWFCFLRDNYVFASHFCNVCRIFVEKMFFFHSFVIFIFENFSFCSCELFNTVSFSYHLQ